MNASLPETPPPGRDPVLARLLRTWTVPESPPPGFSERVWHRLEGRRAAASVAPLAVVLWERLMQFFCRPRMAVAYVALVLLAGAGAGALRGHSTAQGLAGSLQGRYVQSIDPFAAVLR